MKKVALKIPPEKISEIIEKNIIANAVPISSNAYMHFLFVIWYNYIEPNGEGKLDCPYCLQSVLTNFKSMQDSIIEVYKENQLLNSLSDMDDMIFRHWKETIAE